MSAEMSRADLDEWPDDDARRVERPRPERYVLAPVSASRPSLTPGRLFAWAVAGTATALVVATCLAVLLVLVNLLSALGGLNSSIGSLGSVVDRAGQGIGGIAQGIQGLTDPSRPPAPLAAYDAELAALDQYVAGAVLGRTNEFTFTFSDVRRRDESGPPETTYYAVVHREYSQPKETKALGVTIRVDRGEHDYYLYKGQSYRLGRTFYRVNWVSWSDRKIAIGTYRDPNAVAGPVAFAFD